MELGVKLAGLDWENNLVYVVAVPGIVIFLMETRVILSNFIERHEAGDFIDRINMLFQNFFPLRG